MPKFITNYQYFRCFLSYLFLFIAMNVPYGTATSSYPTADDRRLGAVAFCWAEVFSIFWELISEFYKNYLANLQQVRQALCLWILSSFLFPYSR